MLNVFLICGRDGVVQVAISFGKILLQVTRPHTAVLGSIPGTNVYRNVHQYTDTVAEPGILIVQIDSSIYFANSNYIRERCVNFQFGIRPFQQSPPAV